MASTCLWNLTSTTFPIIFYITNPLPLFENSADTLGTDPLYVIKLAFPVVWLSLNDWFIGVCELNMLWSYISLYVSITEINAIKFLKFCINHISFLVFHADVSLKDIINVLKVKKCGCIL